MAGDYRVYDAKGKSLSGKDTVDSETARKLYMQERERTRGQGPGSRPSIVRQRQEKNLESRD